MESGRPKVKILLIEDDEDDYILTRDSLEELPHWELDINWAPAGDLGLELLSAEEYDLCLLDYQLGQTTGIDVLQRIREREINTPVVMLTGQASSEVDEAALDAGATDYLLKSEVDSSRFIRAIRYALARKDTERERLERLKAESANRAKDRFLAHLSHELRTPLSAILGYTELLMNRPASASAHTELSAILRNGRHLLSLLNDVLDLSKIAADKLELNPSQTRVHDLMAEVVSLTQALAIEKRLNLSLESITPVPESIYVDVTRIRQILINLIGNGIKFTHSGEVKIQLELHGPLEQAELHISVVDTGIGIGAADLQVIFKPFEQVDDMVNKSSTGTGLGLAICSELVQRMGGDIRVSSELGEGSCFTVILPIGDVRDMSMAPVELNLQTIDWPQIEQRTLEGRVLVVEDMPDLRNLMLEQIRYSGAMAEGAANGIEALHVANKALAEGKPFDLIFLDLHMPKMDGYQAITELRKTIVDIPILALTAATLKGRAEQLLALGFTDMLAKPMESRMLQSILQHYLQVPERFDSKPAATCHILLVEDDEDASAATAAMLEIHGCKVTVAGSGAECLQALAQQPGHSAINRVVTDLGLPDMDGVSLIQQIRAAHPTLSICVLSGNLLGQEQVRAFNIDLQLQKPLFAEQIKQLCISG